MGVGGISDISTSRRGTVAERHLTLFTCRQLRTLYFCVLRAYCGAERVKAGRRERDEAVATRASGLSDLVKEAIVYECVKIGRINERQCVQSGRRVSLRESCFRPDRLSRGAPDVHA